MGNSAWSRRVPDGPLLLLNPATEESALVKKLQIASSSVKKVEEDNVVAASTNSRANRRRPTYSATRAAKKAVESENEEASSKGSSNGSDTDSKGGGSLGNIKGKQIDEYRNKLAKTVKLRTAIFQMNVKVSISPNGDSIVWYSGKEADLTSKKPLGQFPVTKITTLKTKVDNPKVVEVCVHNPTFESYSFSFLTREARDEWQKDLESYRKFLSMI